MVIPSRTCKPVEESLTFANMTKSKVKRDWLWSNQGLKVGDKMRAIQALSNTLTMNVNKTQGNPDMNIKKYQCRNNIEDDAHILNSCELNHKLIKLRHNDHLVSKIARELKTNYSSAEVWIRRHWRLDLQLLKPDITMTIEGHCYIIEVTCPYETSLNQQRARNKFEKYKPLLKDLAQVNCNS